LTARSTQLRDASAQSNKALAELGGKAQWQHSYVVDDQTFCVYLAEDEAAVQEHALLERLPGQQGHRSPWCHRADDRLVVTAGMGVERNGREPG